VLEEIRAETAQVVESQRELEAQRAELERAKDAAWEEYAPTGKHDDPVDKEAERRYDAAYGQLMGVEKAIAARRKQIAKLNSPEEFDNRMELRLRKGGNMTDENKPKKETARDQGVPEVYLNKETGTFRIGMDARLKSDLVCAALGVESKDALHEFSKSEAEKLIQKRGWESHLERKREILAEKERKATERAAEREKAARERAEAKAAKDAEKKAAASESKGNSTSGGGKTPSKADQARAQREEKAAAAGK
jgi:hypothetical protein